MIENFSFNVDIRFLLAFYFFIFTVSSLVVELRIINKIKLFFRNVREQRNFNWQQCSSNVSWFRFDRWINYWRIEWLCLPSLVRHRSAFEGEWIKDIYLYIITWINESTSKLHDRECQTKMFDCPWILIINLIDKLFNKFILR